MQTKRFLLLRERFDAALQLSESDRQAYLNSLSLEDPELAKELNELLDVHAGAGSLLSKPVGKLWSATSEQAVMEHVGAYRILRELGRGGMGVVYLAVRDDGAFSRRVAIKRMLKASANHELIGRFRSERQVLAAVDHPNIARILDGGETDGGDLYYVMEYVEGELIDDHIRRKNSSLEERISLFQQLCSAVDYLHSLQIIHRDLKPGNVMVADGGAVKLLDFGIAKVLGPGRADFTATQHGPLTPAYASPEQLAGRSVDKRSDVYALGVVFYHLLTGERPNTLRLLPPSALVPSAQHWKKRVTGDLDNIALKALETDPDRRYQSPAEFSTDLRSFLEGRTVVARPVSAPVRAVRFLRRNRRWTAVGVLVLALCLLGAWLGYDALQSRRHLRAREDEVEKLLGSLRAARTKATNPQSVDVILADIRKLREGLQAPWMQSPTSNPERQQLRAQVINGAADFLRSLESVARQNPRIANEAGQTWVALAAIQQKPIGGKVDTAGARDSYLAGAAYLVFAAHDPAQAAEIRTRLESIEQRLREVDGELPRSAAVLLRPPASVTQPHAAKGTVNRRDPLPSASSSEGQSQQQQQAVNPAPQTDPPELAEQFALIESKVTTTEQVVQRMREELNAKGLDLRSSTVADTARLRVLLTNARNAAASGNTARATETLRMLETLAARLLREFGQ